MLIEFRVANHRSLLDEQALTLEAGRGGDADDPRPRAAPGHPKPILPVAALYGANASGKSNLLAALLFMCHAVSHSHSLWTPDAGVPRTPFAWSPPAPSTFEVTWLQEGVRYRYGFVADDERFLEEWLDVWPAARPQRWFWREGDRFKFGGHLRGENRLVQEVTRPNALFLSAAAQLGHPQLGPIYLWFRGVRSVNLWPVGGHFEPQAQFSVRWQLASEGGGAPPTPFAHAFKQLLRLADLGIEDVRVDHGVDAAGRPRSAHGVLFKHQGGDDERAWLPFEEESSGTRRLYRLAAEVVFVLDQGGLLVVDELEANLHPLLALQIIERFNNPATNPRNAQLLFATHDTNLLGTQYGAPPLRRDQVWLTEKDPRGATQLYPLTDFKPRKAENVETGYLQGRYGAIPFLGPLAGSGG